MNHTDESEQRIAELEAEVENLRLAVAAYGSQDRVSNVMVHREHQAGGSYYLPQDTEVRYAVGISPVDDKVTVRHGTADRSALYVIAETGTLCVTEISDRVIEIRVKAA